MKNEPKDLVNAITAIITNEASGDKEAYQKFFDKTLKKYKVNSPSELSDEDKKKFFDEIDAGWEGDNEKKESVDVKLDGRTKAFKEKIKRLEYAKQKREEQEEEEEAVKAEDIDGKVCANLASESVELDEKKMTVNIDHDGSNDSNAKKFGIKLKKGKGSDYSFDATGEQKKLQKYLALHYDDEEYAQELHPEIFESVKSESLEGNKQAALVMDSINKLTATLRPGSALQKDLEKLAGRKLQKEFKDLQNKVDELAFAFEDLEMEINMGESTQKESVELEEASRSKQIKDMEAAQKLLRKVDKAHGQPLFFDKNGDQVDVDAALQSAIDYYKDPDSDIDESVEPTISIGEIQYTVEEFGKLLDEPIAEEKKTKAESYLDWYKKYDPMKDPDMKDMLADLKKKEGAKIAARVTKLVKDNKLFPDALSDAIYYGGLISHLEDASWRSEMSDSDALAQAFADI